MKPTIIGGGNLTPKKKVTVIGSPQPQDEKTVAIRGPSVIPGTLRKRIPAKRKSLKEKHQPKDTVLDKAMEIIYTTNQDDFNLSKAVLWGQNLQEQHNTLVNNTLALSQSEVVSTVTGHLNRMLEILGGLQLEKVFGESPSFLAGIFGRTAGEIKTPEELDKALDEIEQLSSILSGRIGELITLREELESNSKQLQDLSDGIEASMIAALAVAEYFEKKPLQKDLADRLKERSDSLTATLGQIRSDGLMRTLHIEQPMNLTTLVQEVVFNTLPSWITSVTAMRMALHGKHKPNPTEVSEVSRVLKTIIRQLG